MSIHVTQSTALQTITIHCVTAAMIAFLATMVMIGFHP